MNDGAPLTKSASGKQRGVPSAPQTNEQSWSSSVSCQPCQERSPSLVTRFRGRRRLPGVWFDVRPMHATGPMAPDPPTPAEPAAPPLVPPLLAPPLLAPPLLEPARAPLPATPPEPDRAPELPPEPSREDDFSLLPQPATKTNAAVKPRITHRHLMLAMVPRTAARPSRRSAAPRR